MICINSNKGFGANLDPKTDLIGPKNTQNDSKKSENNISCKLKFINLISINLKNIFQVLLQPHDCPTGAKITENKLGLRWAKLSPSWGLKLEFEVEV